MGVTSRDVNTTQGPGQMTHAQFRKSQTIERRRGGGARKEGQERGLTGLKGLTGPEKRSTPHSCLATSSGIRFAAALVAADASRSLTAAATAADCDEEEEDEEEEEEGDWGVAGSIADVLVLLLLAPSPSPLLSST
ncbi:unnamed protein product, partial [Closterium sp. NIES-53]